MVYLPIYLSSYSWKYVKNAQNQIIYAISMHFRWFDFKWKFRSSSFDNCVVKKCYVTEATVTYSNTMVLKSEVLAIRSALARI